MYSDLLNRLTTARLPHSEDSSRQLALSLCKDFKILTTMTRGVKQSIHWDGQTLGIKDDKATDIFHDVAHFQVAHPTRRFSPEYGLGSDVYFKGPKNQALTCQISLAEQELEEKEASALGILWEFSLGCDHQATLEVHGWTVNGQFLLPYYFTDTLKRLHSKGLISKEGHPLKKLWTP